MAIAARRSISPSSLRRWAVPSTDLVMVPLTRLKASNGKQVLGNHTPAHVALKSRLSFIGGSSHREGMLQGADGGFTTGPPAQRSPEPALLLLLGPTEPRVVRAPAAPPSSPPGPPPRARFEQRKNRGRRWPSPALARSRLDVVGGLASRPCYRPDCPGEFGSRSRCRFPPRQSAPAYQTRWACALCLCE